MESNATNEETRMEAWLYDVYFLTEEGPNVDDPREASYTEEYLTYDRVNLATGEPYTQNMQKATVPENIILEVPAGTELTAEQQAKIEAAGGLNKTVGKGFKLRVKNFKGIGRTEGGYMTLIYYLDIVNPSPEMDANGIPHYRNTASLYAQEIPNCGDDEKCDPLEFEKTTIEDINEGNPVTMKVRDVTKDDNAEGLSQATFRPVYEDAPTGAAALARALAATGSAADGSFNENGTATGSCNNTTEPHAHVAAGTAFYKNGNTRMPLNADAKVSLLWDELQQGVLGGDKREAALDELARKAAGGVFASGEGVKHEFKYMDLVDM